MLTFLHLSDLHITTDDADTQFDRDAKIRAALLDDLGKDQRTQFDAILVTGDLAYHGRAEEFARVKIWFEELRASTESSPEAFFVVPGNHDVNHSTVSKGSSLWDLHQSLRKPMAYEERLASLNKKLHDPFDFLAALAEYRVLAIELDCATSPGELAWVQVLGDAQVLEDGSSVRFHGVNSALISDPDDAKANLLLGATQFHHFDSHPSYVNVVLCHHPHAWLMDGSEANDFFRTQAHVVLCGHDHDTRCYMEGNSLRVFAGAVHPNPRESRWEPCYHVIRLKMNAGPPRELIVSVETRVWRDKDKSFGPHVQANGDRFFEQRIPLQAWEAPAAPTVVHSGSPPSSSAVSSSGGDAMNGTFNTDAFAAARRKLIVHFFRLGTLSRYEAVIEAGVWDDSDDAFDGQARWARVFERAEKSGRFGMLWDAVASKDQMLKSERNPFST